MVSLKPKSLTKSRLVLVQRCPKALYLSTYRSQLQAPPSSREQKALAAGQEVGEAARATFPGGRLIDTLDPSAAVEEIEQAISEGVLNPFWHKSDSP